jgi:mRNA-degrading endonuclease toxin of MazEF toxin-antitoxin module
MVPTGPHEDFEELCALSTTGELTAEEWKRLKEHLAHCDSCRTSQQQYENVIAVAIPALADEDGVDHYDGSSPGPWSIEHAEAALMESLREEPLPTNRNLITSAKLSRWKNARSYAIAAAIVFACSVVGYRVGVYHERGTNSAIVPAVRAMPNIPPHTDHTAAVVVVSDARTPSRESETTALRGQIQLDQVEIVKLKDTQTRMGEELAKRSSDLDQTLQERAFLAQQLSLAQTNAAGLQSRLDLMNGQKPEDSAQSLALKARINDLNAALMNKDKEIAQEQDLLQHDRDIRNLIGARNLYIAEIYDVAKTGGTEKPFGRVFYTKDKSLIFYGYDLDQQHGVKTASTFQAWGRRESDHKAEVSLGLLYQDDANQKRWALKFNDAKTIAQIDAVFITVEPEGGSTKPSSKPLLFASLRIDPNHP